MGSLLRAAQSFDLNQVRARVAAGEIDDRAFLGDLGGTLTPDDATFRKVMAKLRAQGHWAETEQHALFALYEALLLAGHPVPDASSRRCVGRVIAQASNHFHARADALMAICIEQGMLDWATSAWAQQVEIDRLTMQHTPLKDRYAILSEAVGDAARAGNLRLLQRLAGVLPHDREARRKMLYSATQPIYKAIWGGDQACVELMAGLLTEEQWQRTGSGVAKPLVMVAAMAGNERLVRYFLARGSDLHASGTMRDELTIVAAVLEQKKPGMVPLLLELGASPDATKPGRPSPLHMAAWHGYPDAAQQLVAAGAKVDYQDERGMSPLGMAGMVGHWQVAKILVDAGADLELCDQCGKTALMWAAVNDRLETFEVLHAAGANLDTVDHDGLTIAQASKGRVKALVERILIDQHTCPSRGVIPGRRF